MPYNIFKDRRLSQKMNRNRWRKDMGLDIYAGTLTRYYANNWKTVVQQWAEENGYQFKRVNEEGEEISDDGELSPEETQEEVQGWRDDFLAVLEKIGQKTYTPWLEDNETPYFTDKPDWLAFGAMLLVAACHSYGEPVPKTILHSWDFTEHPLIERLSQDEERKWSLFRNVTRWVPLPDCFMIAVPLPNGERATIGTVAGLRKELERLNAMAWQADEETIYSWCETEGYPADGEPVQDGIRVKSIIPENTEYDTQSLAKFCYSIFYRALKFAEENQVSIVMDS